jgi:hypothetical protein
MSGFDGHVDAPTVCRGDDSDSTAILPVELAQSGLLVTPASPVNG